MKKFFIVLIIALSALCTYAQKDVTKFLGIPVDGSKTEMIQKLKAKGFNTHPYSKDVLTGEFNGADVNVYIGTNGNKVYRIMLCDANNVDERSIQIRFNKLCRQFENNPKYNSSLSNETIPDNEDISYEMTVNNKRYQALFYQKADTTSLTEQMMAIALDKYGAEGLANLTDEMKADFTKTIMEHMLDLYTKKPVWFIIERHYGKYYIAMYYDNEYNHANGEDL